jgi:IS5 family transposase
MVSLLILKHLRNISDESVVEQWFENIYYQYFSGEKSYAYGMPCKASDLVHFRNRIGDEGIELIFKESIRVNGKDGQEHQATTDTTVQEKNITYPTNNKLHRRIIKKCLAIANNEDLDARQTYTRTLKRLLMDQRFRNHPKNKGKARKADKKKTIAGFHSFKHRDINLRDNSSPHTVVQKKPQLCDGFADGIHFKSL